MGLTPGQLCLGRSPGLCFLHTYVWVKLLESIRLLVGSREKFLLYCWRTSRGRCGIRQGFGGSGFPLDTGAQLGLWGVLFAVVKPCLTFFNGLKVFWRSKAKTAYDVTNHNWGSWQ